MAVFSVFIILKFITCVICLDSETQGLNCYKNGQSDSTAMTLIDENFCFAEGCNTLCKSLGHAFSGNMGCRCYCGDSHDKYGIADEAICNLQCSGNPVYKCGGQSVINVYAVCPFGKYGSSCEIDCPEKCKIFPQKVCHPSTGACIYGCVEPYLLPMCECPPGTYGEGCNFTCSENCQDPLKCGDNGHCSGGCTPGWQPPTCLTECANNTYGYGCAEECSENCIIPYNCNKATGTCLGGCSPGWTSSICDISCPAGTYGEKCKLNCSEDCFNPMDCNNVNGSCTGGCDPESGKIPPKCTSKCLDGFYGDGCNFTCSMTCVDPQKCDDETGECIGGCKPGYFTSNCNTSCSLGWFGENCKNKCFPTCSSGCNPTNGSCNAGCIKGWLGEYCDVEIKELKVAKKSLAPSTQPCTITVVMGNVLLGLLLFL